MKRQITHHKINAANNQLDITVLDERGPGGANHKYEISGPEGPIAILDFQNGPIPEAGVNGLTQEALISVIIDRLEGFQGGPFKSRENAVAITHLETALLWLQKRTISRIARGVEGKLEA